MGNLSVWRGPGTGHTPNIPRVLTAGSIDCPLCTNAPPGRLGVYAVDVGRRVMEHRRAFGRRVGPRKPFERRLLLDSKVVDVPRSSNPMVVILSSSKPFFFNGFQQRSVLLGPGWSLRPRNPI